MNCKSCNTPLKPEAKFCTKCGTRQSNQDADHVAKSAAEETTQATNNNLIMVKQKIFWNIQPGEIARSIKEDEFLQYENAQGIIINDGTTAYIKSGGKVIAEIHGGNYDFVAPAELDKILEQRTGGAINQIRRGWRGLVNLIMGKSIKEQVSNPNGDLKRLESLDQVLEHMKRGDIFAITLKQDRDFQLVFGDLHKNIDDYANFIPLKIRTKILDVETGLRAFFRIKDFPEFTSFYLSDQNSVRTATLANQMTPIIQSVLNDALYDLEITESRLPANVCQMIEDKLKLNDFHGIELQKIIEISTDNEDLERFRELSKELYLSEKELDYLHRSNDFINRLNSVTDEQSIYNKKRELDIYRKMEEINKDRLLTEDEFDKFYMIISREKKIREAQNQEEIETALSDIRQTGLLREEQIKILEDEVSSRADERGFALKLMQLNNAAQYEKTRLGNLQEVELQTILHDLNITRQKDEYQDERFYKERERRHAETADKRDDIEFMRNIAGQERQSQLDSIAQLQRMENEKEDRASQRRMNESQQTIDASLAQEREITERLRAQQTMSEEQIMAQNIQGMDAEAQKEYARSFSAGKDLEQEKDRREELKEILERQERNKKEEQEMMNKMFSHAMDKIVEAGKGSSQKEAERSQEYRDMYKHEQERHDRHQDIALNYTTRPQHIATAIDGQGGQPVPPSSQSTAPTQPTQVSNTTNIGQQGVTGNKTCPKCKKTYDIKERFCEDCGSEL